MNEIDDLSHWEMTERPSGDDWETIGRWLRDHQEMAERILRRWLRSLGDDWEINGRWHRDHWVMTERLLGDDWEICWKWLKDEQEMTERSLADDWEINRRRLRDQWDWKSSGDDWEVTEDDWEISVRWLKVIRKWLGNDREITWRWLRDQCVTSQSSPNDLSVISYWFLSRISVISKSFPQIIFPVTSHAFISQWPLSHLPLIFQSSPNDLHTGTFWDIEGHTGTHWDPL